MSEDAADANIECEMTEETKNHCMNGFIFHYIKRKNSNKLGTTGLHMTKRALFGWTNQVVCLHLT